MALVTGGANPVLRSPRIKRPVFKSDILQQEIKIYNSFEKLTNLTAFHKGLIFLSLTESSIMVITKSAFLIFSFTSLVTTQTPHLQS